MSILGPIFAQDGARIAVTIGDQRIDYARFCGDIDAMACWLLGKGLEPGQRVSLHPSRNSHVGYWDWIMHLGAIRAGLVHSTWLYRPMVRRPDLFGPLCAVVGQRKQMPEIEHERILDFEPPSLAPLAEQYEILRGQFALDGLETRVSRLIATSGTTGTPKMVVWDRAMIARRIEQVHEAGEVSSETILLPILEFATTAGFRYPLAVWQAGGCVILKPTDVVLSENFEAFQTCNMVVASPYVMQEFLSRREQTWPARDRRSATLVGGRTNRALRDLILNTVASELRTVYGSTEGGSIATGDVGALIGRHPGAVGTPFPGVDVEVVGPDHEPLPAGTEGLVRVRSSSVVDSYAFVPKGLERTAGFRDGWFYPGDLGVFLDDGVLAITGRATEQINFRGVKIAVAEIEPRLAEIEGVEEACISVVPMGDSDLLAVAVVGAGEPDLAGLRARLADELPPLAAFRIIRVPSLPRNRMGKIMRRRLAALLADHWSNNSAQG